MHFVKIADDLWDNDDVSTTATDKEKADMEDIKSRERAAVSEMTTEPQQLKLPVVDSVSCVMDEVNKEQITEPIAISKELLSTQFSSSHTAKTQDKEIKMIPNDNIISAKSFVDNADSVCSTISESVKSVDPDSTVKIEKEHSPKIVEATTEEISEKLGNKENGTMKSENQQNLHSVDRSNSNSKSSSGVALDLECDVVAHNEGSCDPVPPVALRNNSSDESVDSSWSKLSEESNVKGTVITYIMMLILIIDNI